MRRFVVGVLLIVAVLAGIVLARAATLPSKQLAVAPRAFLSYDTAAVLDRFAAALRIPTISHQDAARTDSGAFEAMLAHIAAAYPRVNAQLARERVDRGVLYTWAGANAAHAPLVLVAHLDVVPVEPGTDSLWTHPPFGGVVANGRVWGRGAFDDKGSAMALLEAVEHELAAGTVPDRPVILALGMDEEVGGTQGAAQIVQRLRARGVRAAMVLDEGGAVIDSGPLPVSRPMALVGIAEKGYVSLDLTVVAQGGHSSMPPRETSIGILGAAVAALERSPMPGSLRGPTEALFDYLAPEMSFGMRALFANRWLFGPVIERVLAGAPASNAMLRTTTAPTMFSAGTKDNVLASRARAVVNFRVFPGESIANVVQHVRRVVDDERVQVDTLRGGTPASPVSPVDSTFTALHRAIAASFPDAIVAPYLVLAATDAKHYTAIADHVYRFAPLRLHNRELAGVHGTDESVAIPAYFNAIGFYRTLLRGMPTEVAPGVSK